MSKEIGEAIEVLSKAMNDDPSYAWSWYSSLVMSYVDAGGDKEIGEAAAKDFLNVCFDVDADRLLEIAEEEDEEEEKTPLFLDALETLINRYSLENESDTPDYILAEYVANCLTTFSEAVRERDAWHSFVPFGAKAKVPA